MSRRSHSDKPKKSAAQLDYEIDSFLKKGASKRGQRVATLIAAFRKSPGIIITEKGDRRSLIVRSGEMQNRREGRLRATMFGMDGPRGHITKNSDRELAEELAQYYLPTSVKPATDAEVMRWTSSPEFAHGSKLVAFTQAANTLSYRAGKTDQYDRARQIESCAHKHVASDLDKAISVLEAGIKEIG